MQYRNDYYIMVMSLPVSTRSRKVMKVKGSDPIAILFSSLDYADAPEIFIHKGDHGYIASDSKTGIMIYEAARLKDVMQWIADPNNLKRVLEAYNRPFIAKQKQIFQDLVKADQA